MEEYRKYKQNYNKKTNYSNYNYNNAEYYKKTEQKTISYTSNENNSRIKHYTSLTNKNNYHIPDRSKREKSNSSLGKSLNNSSSSKNLYTYAGRVREKNNYVYYVSGIGYVNKEGEKKPEKKVIKNKIPTKPRKQSENKVNAIRIQQKRYTEEDKEELIDNYQYHETKDLKKDNKKTLVSHRRLCEPFYSLVHHRSSKKYSSYTEQPRKINSSFQRNEYEIKESRKQPDNDKFNYRTERFSGQKSYNYIPSNQQNKNTNYHNYASYQQITTNSYNRRGKSGDMETNYINHRRDFSESRKKNNSNHNIEEQRNTYDKTYEIRSNRTYGQNYGNIQRHEIKVSSKDKNIKYNYNKGSNIIERKRYVPRKTKNNQAPINKNIVRKELNDNKIHEMNYRTNKIYNVPNSRNESESYENNRNYYSYESVEQNEQNYEQKRRMNIPQHMEEITFYESKEQNNPISSSNIQIEMHERSQNIPQQIKQIEVHEIKENIPQHVQEIQVYAENDNKLNQNEEIYQTEQATENYEQQMIGNPQQEMYQVNQEEHLEGENKEIEENHQNKNIVMENNNNEKRVEIQIEENNNEQIQKNRNFQIQHIPQNEEKQGNENQSEQIEIQQIKYKQYIPEQNIRHYLSRENVNENEELYYMNKRQYIDEFNRNENYININSGYCPIHGYHINQYHPNFIYNMNPQLNENYIQMNQNTYHLNSLIGEDGMVGNTNNYKFYESKNIRDEEEPNSMTFHHKRDSGNNLNKNSSSNAYVATKVIPLISEPNYQHQHMDNSTNKLEHNHFHASYENCPIHGRKFFEASKISEK